MAACYHYAVGVKEDHKAAFTYYKKAAEAGDAAAMAELGRCYQRGLVSHPNPNPNPDPNPYHSRS
eukprot:270949-Amorphochlora_amoeboformis.AAC.1